MTVYRDGEPQGPPIGSAPSEAETLDQQLEESEEEARSRRFGFYMRSSAGDAEEAGSDDDSIDTRQRVGHSLESAQQLLDSAGTYGGDTGLDVELHSARAAADAAADEQQSLQEFLQWSESGGAPPATLRAWKALRCVIETDVCRRQTIVVDERSSSVSGSHESPDDRLDSPNSSVFVFPVF